MLEYNEIKEKKIIIYEDEPCEVLENHVARTQQRKPQNQVKLRSLISGKSYNATFHVSDSAEEAEMSKREVKFLYANKGEYWFCDPEKPADRFEIDEKILANSIKFLKPNMIATALVWGEDDDEVIIKLALPIKMELAVKETQPSIKGNTASGGGKPAVLETGAVVQVPFFVEAGDIVRVNTETGEYVERV